MLCITYIKWMTVVLCFLFVWLLVPLYPTYLYIYNQRKMLPLDVCAVICEKIIFCTPLSQTRWAYCLYTDIQCTYNNLIYKYIGITFISNKRVGCKNCLARYPELNIYLEIVSLYIQYYTYNIYE